MGYAQRNSLVYHYNSASRRGSWLGVGRIPGMGTARVLSRGAARVPNMGAARVPSRWTVCVNWGRRCIGASSSGVGVTREGRSLLLVSRWGQRISSLGHRLLGWVRRITLIRHRFFFLDRGRRKFYAFTWLALTCSTTGGCQSDFCRIFVLLTTRHTP